jgi:hypothetical protein
MTAEQMCRDLLEQALADRLVSKPRDGGSWGKYDPQAFTSGDLCGMANLMQMILTEHDAMKATMRAEMKGRCLCEVPGCLPGKCPRNPD